MTTHSRSLCHQPDTINGRLGEIKMEMEFVILSVFDLFGVGWGMCITDSRMWVVVHKTDMMVL